MRASPSISRGLLLGSSVVALLLILASYFFATTGAQAIDISTTLLVRICGNGIVELGENCDDGTMNNLGGYGSSTAARQCNADCFTFGPYCGDGVLQVRFTEQCDDGNNTSGDLCDAICREETPVLPRATGAPPRGSTPQLPAPPGTIPSETLTKVVLQGKAYPNSSVNILLDGKLFGTVLADSNADFLFTTTNITPGTASFGFNAKDRYGTDSITTTNVFDVVQSAVTTVANIFLPPTISVKPPTVAPGGLILLSGQTVPSAHVVTEIHAENKTLEADADTAGDWALQIDTDSLKNGDHLAKARFQLTNTVRSGFGKSVAFFVGTKPVEGSCGKPDMNGDEKVNLVDFSIFLLSWNKTDANADYNCDKNVNLADFSIMLFSWTG
jgi:cysteine-rich repeat protein